MFSYSNITVKSTKHRRLFVFADSNFQHAGSGKRGIQVPSLPSRWKSESEITHYDMAWEFL